MKFIIILLSMVFFHIVDDYYLQGWLASAKQKSWWEKNAPEKMYRNDYMIALIMHSFSWSFMIMLPVLLYIILSGNVLREWLVILYFANMSIHGIVDDLKANKRQINLMQDQITHLIQIIMTWIAFCISYMN